MKFNKLVNQIMEENFILNELDWSKSRDLADEYEQEEYVRRRTQEAEDYGTWYIRLDGKIHKGKDGNPGAYDGLKHAQNVWKKLKEYPSFQNKKIVKFTMKPVDVPEEFPKNDSPIE